MCIRDRSTVATAVGETLDELSTAREAGSLPPGRAGPLVTRLIAIAETMRERAGRLS